MTGWGGRQRGSPWCSTLGPLLRVRVTEVFPRLCNGRVPERQYGGRVYGMKSGSFPPYMDLPAKVDARFELALGSDPAPRDRLREFGWIVRDPYEVSTDPWVYQRFIQRSKAELAWRSRVMWRPQAAGSATASGWFSDRSAAYLASGRPVVTQDTGFSRWLQTDGGVLAFRSPEEAIAAVERVSRDYAVQCRAAREAVEEYFDARVVLPSLLDRAVAASRKGAHSP
jgi:hypothetical protein